MSAPDVDVFLAHFGVKGMRWGVHRTPKTSGSSKSSPHDLRQAGLDVAKVLAKKGAVPAGAAVAASSGIGLPAVAVLAVSARVLSDPDIQAALTSTASWVKAVASDGVFDLGLMYKYGPDTVAKTKAIAEDLPKKKDGGLFNPDAKLDTSRTGDLGTPEHQQDIGWHPPEQKRKWDLPW